MSLVKEMALARSFKTVENMELIQTLGKVGAGFLYSHIIMYDIKIIITKLRYPEEFVRHKRLDLYGDLYLLGLPIRDALSTATINPSYSTHTRLFRAADRDAS